MKNKKAREKKKNKSSFFKDFKAFISKGNVIDLAVAVIIGGAFGKIVTSLVNDIVMPFISVIVGGADVSDWKWVIKPATFDAGGAVLTAESALRYGAFLQAIIDFLIIAFFIFLALRLVTASHRKLAKIASELTEKNKADGKAANDAATSEANVEEAVTPEVAAPTINAGESQEEILKDIRELLKSQVKPVKNKKFSK